jgi:hypothetical protein
MTRGTKQHLSRSTGAGFGDGKRVLQVEAALGRAKPNHYSTPRFPMNTENMNDMSAKTKSR